MEFVQHWDLLFTVGCRPVSLPLDGVIRYLGSRDREQRTKNCVTGRPELRSGRWLLMTRRCFVWQTTVTTAGSGLEGGAGGGGGGGGSWCPVLPFLLYRPDCLARDSPCAGAEYKYQNPVVAALDLQNPRHSHAGRSSRSQPRPLALTVLGARSQQLFSVNINRCI